MLTQVGSDGNRAHFQSIVRSMIVIPTSTDDRSSVTTDLLSIFSDYIITQIVFFYAPVTKSRGHINLPLSIRPFVRPDIDTWFVRLSPTVLELQL